jgi:hypothetical protein
MNWLVMLVALGLFALWIIALSTSTVASWFLWLVFAAACVLFVSSIVDFTRLR